MHFHNKVDRLPGRQRARDEEIVILTAVIVARDLILARVVEIAVRIVVTARREGVGTVLRRREDKVYALTRRVDHDVIRLSDRHRVRMGKGGGGIILLLGQPLRIQGLYRRAVVGHVHGRAGKLGVIVPTAKIPALPLGRRQGDDTDANDGIKRLSIPRNQGVRMLTRADCRTVGGVPAADRRQELRVAGNGNGKTIAIIERIVADRGHAIGNRHARKRGAIIERIVTDGGHAIRNRHARKGVAILERIVADGGHAVGNRHARKILTIIERRVSDRGHAIRNRHARKSGAIIERIVTDGGHAIPNRHTRKRGAIRERRVADGGDTCRNFEMGIGFSDGIFEELRTILGIQIPLHTLIEVILLIHFNIHQCRTLIKHKPTDGSDAFRDAYTCKRGTAIDRA